MENILSAVLSQNSSVQSDFQKVLWLANVMKWIQRPRTNEEKNAKRETVYTIRLRYLLNMLKNNPQWQKNFVDSITSLLLQVSSPYQYSKIGISQPGFIQEFIHRLQEKILPKRPLAEDLESLVSEIFPNEEESLYVDFIAPDVIEELLNLFQDKQELHLKIKRDLLSAAYILSVQTLDNLLGIRAELHQEIQSFETLPEFQLQGLLQGHQIQTNLQVEDRALALIKKIESDLDLLYSSMQTEGVKIELVYLFQAQKRKLSRLTILLGFLNAQNELPLNFRLFISQLILDSSHHKSFRSFASENLSLLTERIVQSSSRIGEHYVTYTWGEFKDMFRSAAGGGALTSLTVLIKFGLGHLGLQGFLKGLLESLNYSGSFVMIQIMGWTLATKQPSNTAPFIAAELSKSTTEARRSIVALLRTQFIAVLGNLSLVFPICLIISWIALWLEHPLLDEEHAQVVLNSSNIAGPSILFAILTGGLLFAGSLAAGWVENWMVLTQIPKRIRYNKALRKWLKPQRTERFSDFITHNSNALAANIILGFLLGMTPAVAKFLGLGLEVRHVTLATGSFGLALPILLERGLPSWDLVNSVLGIFAIGFLNIAVSFTLAFLLASISSKAKFSSFRRLFASGLRLVLVRPWLLLVPEKTDSK